MSLKQRSAIISFGSIIFIVVVVGIVVYGNVLSGLQAVENQRVKNGLSSLQYLLNDKIAQIDTKLSDWAIWDDSYYFLENKNQKYIDTNLSAESFSKLGIDEVLFINNKGALVTSVLSTGHKETRFPDDLYVHFSTGSALLEYDSKNGIIATNDGVMFFAIAKALKSDGSGPASGYIVFASYINSNTINKLKELTQFEVVFTPWDDPRMSADCLNAKREYLEAGKPNIVERTENIISGYLIITDIFKKPQAIVRMDIVRDITNQGKTSMMILLTVISLTGLVGATVNFFLVNNSVIKRILNLSMDLKKVGDINNPKMRLSVDDGNSDEINFLYSSINTMLSDIEKSHSQLQKGTEEVDAALIQMEKQNEELIRGRSAVLNILEDERHLEEELKKEKEGVEKKVIERTLELANEKSRLTAAISSLPQAFLIVSTNHTIVTHNNRLEQILGESNEVWTLRKVNDRLSDKFDLEKHVQTAMQQRKTIHEKEVLAGAKYTSVYIAPILSLKNTTSDEVIGAIITITDITEARLISRSKDEFFSIASHELRTPLTAIRGNTAMILDYYTKELSNPQIMGMIQDTHDASIRLIGIVNDFLDMSRLELGKMEYKKENVSLSRIAEKIIVELTANALKKETTILCNIEEKALVLGDPGKIEEILLNLVGNALKFTDKGRITISTVIEEENIRVEVADTGKGIPLPNQSLLFHKFQQAGSSLTTRDGAKGTGLGLYISRLMAEGMGGKLVLVKSIENEGSVFCLTLPKYSEEL